jgi:predicted SAM-dependent methyltransferase
MPGISKILKKHQEGVLLYTIVYNFLNIYLKFYGWLHQNRKIVLNSFSAPVKVNLGSGLKVASGWINIDFNLPALFSPGYFGMTKRLYRLLKKLNYSELDRPFRFTLNETKFIDILKNNNFLCHNLLYGIPLESASVDYIYSSHMIGFCFPLMETKYLLSEAFRTLKPGGKMRLSIVDGDYYWRERKRQERSHLFFSDDNCFSFSEIKTLLEEAKFTHIRKMEYRQGIVADLLLLDDFSPEVDRQLKTHTLYLEAEKC